MTTIKITTTADTMATVIKEAQDDLAEIRQEFNTLTAERDDLKERLEQAETLIDDYRTMFTRVSARVKSLERDRHMLISDINQYIAPQYSYDSNKLNRVVNELGGIMFVAWKLFLNPDQLEEWVEGESVPRFAVLKEIYELYYQQTGNPDIAPLEE